MKAAPAIGFRCRVSPLLVAATFIMFLLAIFAVSLVSGPRLLHGLLIGLAGACTGVALARLLRPRIESLLWRQDGGVELHLRGTSLESGRDVLGAVQDARVMGPLIALTLRWPRRGHGTIWLLPDNLDADTRRRLRMRLGAMGGASLVSGNADSG